MHNSIPNLNLASGTITITSPPADIEIYYLEHPSRNCTLQPIVNGLELNERQTAELEQKISVEQDKLLRGRRIYSQLIQNEEAWISDQ